MTETEAKLVTEHILCIHKTLGSTPIRKLNKQQSNKLKGLFKKRSLN